MAIPPAASITRAKPPPRATQIRSYRIKPHVAARALSTDRLRTGLPVDAVDDTHRRVWTPIPQCMPRAALEMPPPWLSPLFYPVVPCLTPSLSKRECFEGVVPASADELHPFEQPQTHAHKRTSRGAAKLWHRLRRGLLC